MKNIYIVFLFFLLSGCSQKFSIDKPKDRYKHCQIDEGEKRSMEYTSLHQKIERLTELGETIFKTGNDEVGKFDILYDEACRDMVDNRYRRYTKEKLYPRAIQEKSFVQQEKTLIKIKSHSYTTLTSIDELKRLKNTSTYVLFPRNLVGQDKSTKKYKRYSKVLELIQELKKVKDNTSNIQNARMKYENKFIIFKNDLECKEKVTVETYNYELANEVFDFFKAIVSPSFSNQEGPFFITVTKNIFDMENEFSFLYVNLSSFNDSAIKQALDSYKHRLIEKGYENVNTIEGWHYWLLSALTNFNDDIKIFQTAFAGEN